MLNLAQEEDAGKSCKLISFIDGMINELLYNTLKPVAEAGDYAVSVFGQKWTLGENFRSVYSGMESGLLNHEFTDAKSYYAGKIFGDILSIALGVGMGVASAEILGNGIAASIGITVLSDGVGVTVSVGTLVVTVAVSGVVLLEGTAIMTSAVGNIGDNFNNFANDGGKGKSETGNSLKKVKNNKEANKVAREFGYEGAEELKQDFVFNEGAKFNMMIDTETGEVVLVSIKDSSIQVHTGLFR